MFILGDTFFKVELPLRAPDIHGARKIKKRTKNINMNRYG